MSEYVLPTATWADILLHWSGLWFRWQQATPELRTIVTRSSILDLVFSANADSTAAGYPATWIAAKLCPPLKEAKMNKLLRERDGGGLKTTFKLQQMV